VHLFGFNPAENRARVDATQYCRLVNGHHLHFGVARRTPNKRLSGTADVEQAIGFDGDLGSCSLHISANKVRTAGGSDRNEVDASTRVAQ
jgi:hypothetical protein